MSAGLKGTYEVLAYIDKTADNIEGLEYKGPAWRHNEVLATLLDIREGLTADPEWSVVVESNLRAELAEVKAQLAAEIVAETTSAVLYTAAIAHLEGERDRARDLAALLEQEVHALTVGSGRRAL